MSTIRINLWSGPRNVSTALMYAFAQRRDTQVVDEPLYAHYLTVSDADEYHPGAADVLATQDNDGARVVRELSDKELAWKRGGTLEYQQLVERSRASQRPVEPLREPQADRPHYSGGISKTLKTVRG